MLTRFVFGATGCNEGIDWYNMANPMFMSASQLVNFTNLLAVEQGGVGRGADNRLIQPLNGRIVSTSVAPPPPIAVSGSLGFRSSLATAAAFEAEEAELISVLADVLAVPESAINITSYTMVADTAVSTNDFLVSFSISAPTAGAAATLSGMIAAATAVPFGTGAQSTLVAALKTGAPDLDIVSVVPSPVVAVQSTDPMATVASLTANLADLSAEVDSLNTTVTTLMATLTALQTSVAALPTAATVAALPTAASVAALATTVTQLSTLQTTTSTAIAALTTAVNAL